jgi:hypothetical protein
MKTKLDRERAKRLNAELELGRACNRIVELEHVVENDGKFAKMQTQRIAELEANLVAEKAATGERIRIATKDAEHEISRLENRVNSDAAFIERKRMEHVALKHVASEFRSLIIDGIRGTGGTSKFITSAEIAAEFDKKE